MLSQTFLWGYHCFKHMLPRVSCFRWHIIGLKPKYFSNCYFPLLLGFLYPLTLEAEVLRYCCEWHCLTIYGKTLQEGAYASKTKHQPSPSARIRVVSSTCQAIRAKKTRGSCGFRGQQMFHGFWLTWKYTKATKNPVFPKMLHNFEDLVLANIDSWYTTSPVK